MANGLLRPRAYSSLPVHFLSLFGRIAHIAYAFTKSDYKTTFIPVMFYAYMSAKPSLYSLKVPRAAFWLWIHLFQFCVANQVLSPEEDALNKPYRPIPSKLISVPAARALRWSLAPICLGLSWVYGLLNNGVGLALAFALYNEFGLDSYWLSKNLLNAVGSVLWNVGAAKIASGGLSNSPISHHNSWMAPYVVALIVTTTSHIQDFRDEAGDLKQGRLTLPILMPKFSRAITPLILTSWSFGLAHLWLLELRGTASLLFIALGLFTGGRIFLYRSEEDDKFSYRCYLIWLCVAQVLPFCGTA
ncbi:hypothetical protein EYR36_004166 [Pleurotus pulmonarius]|nr:hypothetical protein EYR36_004166 [Pleurotus pulmonarius]